MSNWKLQIVDTTSGYYIGWSDDGEVGLLLGQAQGRDDDVEVVTAESAAAEIIAWKKDWERWQHDIISSIDTTTYDILDQPIWRTKNQLIIASAKTNMQIVNV